MIFGPRSSRLLACALLYKLPSKCGHNPVSAGTRAHSVAIWTDFDGVSAVDGLVAPVFRLVISNERTCKGADVLSINSCA